MNLTWLTIEALPDKIPVIQTWQVIVAVVIFLLCYGFIISEKINRSIVAISGAALLVILGIVKLEKAYEHHIEWATIFLLLGMMIMVGIANKSGIFQALAVWTAKGANGDPVKILIRLAFFTAAGAAFIDNVTTVLLVAPLTVALCQVLKISPVPFLITEILICNIGGAATLVGDPPNIMIGAAGSHVGITFNAFLIHITPVIIFSTIAVTFLLSFYYKKSLSVAEENKSALQNINPWEYIRDTDLAKKSVVVFALTLLGFITHSVFHLEPATVAMTGAIILMLVGTKKEEEVEKAYQSVEWITIFFFAGLFVIVGGLVDMGVIRWFAEKMIYVTGGNLTAASFIILWSAGVGSAFVDNIPLVATMIPLIQDMGTNLGLDNVAMRTLWWSLALGACLGGNGTLIASSANLCVAAVAIREGTPISFTEFLKISVPITIISLILATLYVLIAFIKLGLA